MIKGRPRVLFVDDDMQTLAIMELYLKDMAEVLTANSGRQAIELLRRDEVDIIFLDVDMPVMDGFKTLEHFQNMEQCVNVPVIFVTGKRDKSTVMNSLMMGGDGYIIKPVQKELLRRRVTELCEYRDRMRQKKTILAIDDDMAYLKIIDRYLRDSYNVVIINSPQLAVTYMMSNTPDLIIVDYQMPLHNGVSLLNMLNRNNDGPPIPCIILSGVVDKIVLADCYSCNPMAVLAKPVSRELLLETVGKVFRKNGFPAYMANDDAEGIRTDGKSGQKAESDGEGIGTDVESGQKAESDGEGVGTDGGPRHVSEPVWGSIGKDFGVGHTAE